MVLLTAENIRKSYGERIILKDVSLYINDSDKIGIVGINGEGKSTLLRIIAGGLDYDNGEIITTRGLRIAYLPQTPVFEEEATVIEAMECEKNGADEFEAKRILTKLGINDFDCKTNILSGGQRKRIAIARALAAESDLLILDEPTNHLDSEMIIWLENFLKGYKGAIIMITHDRYFLDRVTNRIVEVDRGVLYSYETNYSGFIEEKSARMEIARSAEKKRQAFLRKEIEWVRRGVLARGTKSKARLDNYERIKNQEGLQERQRLELSSIGSRLGKKIIEIDDVSKSYDGNTVISGFSYNMLRDDRIGIVGSNGSGKSTLLKLIAGKLEPDSGSIEWGETIKIGYFSQESEEMDLSMRVIDYVKEAGEFIETPDGMVSAAKMLERFLFDGEAQWSTIGRLSGGERRRLELMRVLMTAPNVLLLDEPTNDLDIETLCILEEYIESFAGVVIAVSHDRYFLDKISTQIFELTPYGEIKRYPGNYADYEQKRVEFRAASSKPKGKTERTVREEKPKFTFKEQREFDTIDDDIAELEARISDIDNEMAQNATDFTRLNELANEKTELEAQLEEKTERWVYLNEKAEEIEEYRRSNR
ncbi:MAG: ABC-F family ATP-binding cassette domain-containing protein [Oscillospiraceae bacterium]|nr:ABC-F family ATP-binding cassette domain-containing protein [Oscillospiraceae bacterium]